MSRSLMEGKNSFLLESWRASTSAAASAAAAASLSRWVDTGLRVFEGASSNIGRPFTTTPDPASRSRRSARSSGVSLWSSMSVSTAALKSVSTSSSEVICTTVTPTERMAAVMDWVDASSRSLLMRIDSRRASSSPRAVAASARA